MRVMRGDGRPFWILAFCLGLGASVWTSCGGDDESCPGTICNNCAQDCLEINPNCGSGESEACVGLEFFGQDNPDDLRCVFCQ